MISETSFMIPCSFRLYDDREASKRDGLRATQKPRRFIPSWRGRVTLERAVQKGWTSRRVSRKSIFLFSSRSASIDFLCSSERPYLFAARSEASRLRSRAAYTRKALRSRSSMRKFMVRAHIPAAHGAMHPRARGETGAHDS